MTQKSKEDVFQEIELDLYSTSHIEPAYNPEEAAKHRLLEISAEDNFFSLTDSEMHEKRAVFNLSLCIPHQIKQLNPSSRPQARHSAAQTLSFSRKTRRSNSTPFISGREVCVMSKMESKQQKQLLKLRQNYLNNICQQKFTKIPLAQISTHTQIRKRPRNSTSVIKPKTCSKMVEKVDQGLFFTNIRSSHQPTSSSSFAKTKRGETAKIEQFFSPLKILAVQPIKFSFQLQSANFTFRSKKMSNYLRRGKDQGSKGTKS